jgi:acyl-ACP thioesterase
VTVSYRVRFDECGPDGAARASTLARYAQDAAWVHSESLGFDRAWYRQRGRTWLVRSMELQLLESIQIGETMPVRTEVAGFRRVWARRRTTFGSQETPRALATTDWAMVDDRGRPTRIPPELEAHFEAEPATFSPLRVARFEAATDGRAVEQSFRVRRRDVDPLDHVNNAVYFDYLEESVAASGRGAMLDRLPRTYRLEFHSAAGPGERLAAMVREVPNDGIGAVGAVGLGYMLRSELGAELVRGRLEMGGTG